MSLNGRLTALPPSTRPSIFCVLTLSAMFRSYSGCSLLLTISLTLSLELRLIAGIKDLSLELKTYRSAALDLLWPNLVSMLQSYSDGCLPLLIVSFDHVNGIGTYLDPPPGDLLCPNLVSDARSFLMNAHFC
jgi:hypothetical protein